MITINWAEGVNKRVLRNGTEWEATNGFIEDETMSGKKKRRIAHNQKKRPFTVSMRFTLAEYTLFDNWWNTSCRKGLYAFRFPRIDAISDTDNAVYQFADGSAPKYSNPSGDLINCSMEWEEVGFIND